MTEQERPRTDQSEAFRLLLGEADVRWPDQHTRLAATLLHEKYDAALEAARTEGRQQAVRLLEDGHWHYHAPLRGCPGKCGWVKATEAVARLNASESPPEASER